MRTRSVDVDDDPLDREFDFAKSRPNPYWLGMVDRHRVRLLDKDVAEVFPDNTSVNEALRTLLRLQAPKKRSARTVAAPKKKVRS